MKKQRVMIVIRSNVNGKRRYITLTGKVPRPDSPFFCAGCPLALRITFTKKPLPTITRPLSISQRRKKWRFWKNPRSAFSLPTRTQGARRLPERLRNTWTRVVGCGSTAPTSPTNRL